jgi:membrane protease YdiL (CAAX protease family)
MQKRNRWVFAYLIVFFIEMLIITLYAHTVQPRYYILSPYLFILSSLASFILLFPFFIIMWLGYSKPEKIWKRAIGRGYLIWILCMTIPLIMSVLGVFSENGFFLYFLFVMAGFFLVRYFRLPYGYALLPILFPGVALLYLLIYGQYIEEKASLLT